MTLEISVSAFPCLKPGTTAAERDRLLIPNSAWLSATAGAFVFGNRGHVTFRIKGDIVCQLTANKWELAAGLRALADKLDTPVQPEPVPSGSIQTPAIKNPTPAQVIKYFQDSPVLASMAGDVEAILRPLVTANDDLEVVLTVCDRNELVTANGEIRRGAQARIAAALNVPNAGSYRSRIIKVLERLCQSKSTTTAQLPATVPAAA